MSLFLFLSFTHSWSSCMYRCLCVHVLYMWMENFCVIFSFSFAILRSEKKPISKFITWWIVVTSMLKMKKKEWMNEWVNEWMNEWEKNLLTPLCRTLPKYNNEWKATKSENQVCFIRKFDILCAYEFGPSFRFGNYFFIVNDFYWL